MSALRKMLREQARRQHAAATAANKAIERDNTRLKEEHLAELARLPDGWTSVELAGAARPARHVPEKPGARAKLRRRGGLP